MATGETLAPGGTVVRPRDAATVIVMRPRADGSGEVYMVLRSAKSPFMPGTLVFPGGRVDDGDGTPGSDIAFERAARRECEEEIGLRLRDDELRWFDTWVTPSGEPRRYHARFFFTALRQGAGASARADGHETHSGRWATLAEHLAAWEREEIDLPPPTLSILMRLRDVPFDDFPTELSGFDPNGPIIPKLHGDLVTGSLVMPHDPDYATLPGVAGPTPARVHGYPLRFVRSSTRWLPRFA